MLPLPLEDLVHDKMADRLREAEHDALVARARDVVDGAGGPARVVHAVRVRHTTAALLRLLAERLDTCGTVISTRTESVPIQPYLRR